MKYCQNCGNAMLNEDRVCSQCGISQVPVAEPRVKSIIRTRFFRTDFCHLFVKILVNPAGFTAFCALI